MKAKPTFTVPGFFSPDDAHEIAARINRDVVFASAKMAEFTDGNSPNYGAYRVIVKYTGEVDDESKDELATRVMGKLLRLW